MGFMPGAMDEYRPWLEEGFRRAGNGKSLKDFSVHASVHVEVDNDVAGALGRLKPEVALYVGGMGHRSKNFHNDIMVRRGFGDAAKGIQELYLAGRKDEAIAAVPDEWVDMKSLVGPPARIRQRYRAWEEAVPMRSTCARVSPRRWKRWRRQHGSTESRGHEKGGP